MTIRELTSTDKFFLLAGPCVIEGEEMAMRIAEKIVAMTSERGIPYVFKGSYRKANRHIFRDFVQAFSQQEEAICPSYAP